MSGGRRYEGDRYSKPDVPYPYRVQPPSLRMQKGVCARDHNGGLRQHTKGTACASAQRAVPYTYRLLPTGMGMACNNSSADGSTIFGATGGADVVDHCISGDNDLHEVIEHQGTSTLTPQSNHYPWHNQDYTARSWIPLAGLDPQLSPYQGHNSLPVMNNKVPVGAWSPSEDSQDYWNSHESTAMTSQPSFDARYHDMMENNSTWRPPLMNNGRSRRSSPRSIKSSRIHPYGQTPSYDTGGVDGYEQPQRAMPADSLTVLHSYAQDLGTRLTSASSCPVDLEFAPPNVDGEFPKVDICECGARYEGLYSKSNLQRHQRLKGHGRVQNQEERQYDCERPDCLKSYKRQDARVKHYRTHHPDLAGPALSRRPQQQM